MHGGLQLLHCAIRTVLHAPGPSRAHISLLDTVFAPPNGAHNALRIVISMSVRTELSRFCPSKLTYPGLGISNWGCERFGWYCPLCVVRPGIPLVALRIPDLDPDPEFAVLSV